MSALSIGLRVSGLPPNSFAADCIKVPTSIRCPMPVNACTASWRMTVLSWFSSVSFVGKASGVSLLYWRL